MTDKQLLELAAKAAGINLKHMSECEGHSYWNPLTDDGDALRLAVKLRMDVCAGWVEIDYKTDEPRDVNESSAETCLTRTTNYCAYVEHDGDPYAATRLAIVRAAAEIGKGEGHA